MNKTKVGSVFLLGLTALIWGVAFVAQSVGMDYVGPFTFNTARSVLGGIVLIPCILLFDKRSGRALSLWGTVDKKARRMLVIGGVLCGIALAAGSALQQIGIKYTTVGKAGFITALYIILVPLLGIFTRKRVPPLVWVSVGIAVIGMYFLCITEGFTVSKGDFYVFLCAVAFSFHILIIDHFAGKVDGVRMSCIQFFVCAAVSAIPMAIFESPDFSVILSACLPIAYAGILSSGAGYTLQILAQKNTHPVLASLILSLESVFAALAGWMLLGQHLSARELLGSGLVFAAILLSQLKPQSQSKPVSKNKLNGTEVTSE